MCRFCDNLRKQKERNHETGALYRYRVDLVTETTHAGLSRSFGRENSHYELNYCPECGKKLSQLRACPFCDQEVAVIVPSHELNSNEVEPGFFAVCNFNNGGCGASTGWKKTEEEAEEAWNRRAGR